MLCDVDWLYTCEQLKLDEVEHCWSLFSPASYRPEMSHEELGLHNGLNDCTTWQESVQSAADKLSQICICHAIHGWSDISPILFLTKSSIAGVRKKIASTWMKISTTICENCMSL
jgi:hypothetical protein